MASRDKHRDAFMMDLENSILQSDWDSSKRPHPIGRNRYLDPAWAAVVRAVVSAHSDVTLAQYIEWCRQGGGDACFQLPEEEEVRVSEQEIAEPNRPWPENEFSYYFDRARKYPHLTQAEAG